MGRIKDPNKLKLIIDRIYQDINLQRECYYTMATQDNLDPTSIVVREYLLNYKKIFKKEITNIRNCVLSVIEYHLASDIEQLRKRQKELLLLTNTEE